ncbi:hypothetical protein, partial [Ralstonia pseudosolanacearum]|uniref:hypothetical protein n=1 Tax=Ralstonia pseudosolanacearum TaxID=1310165 RepID=UPI003221AE08
MSKKVHVPRAGWKTGWGGRLARVSTVAASPEPSHPAHRTGSTVRRHVVPMRVSACRKRIALIQAGQSTTDRDSVVDRLWTLPGQAT